MKEEIKRNHNMSAQDCFLARKPMVDMYKEQHDGCNPFIIHEKKPKVQHLELKGQLHTSTILNQR